jgi:surfactin synthase thioesterase subunit
MTTTSKWLDSLHVNTGAELRLFCFAHAGGAANFFGQWWRKLPANIEVCPVQLPGRWSRWREEPLRDVVAASRLLVRELSTELAAKPFIFYGHSLGGLIAYETILRLREEGRALPRAFMVSGRSPPDAPLYRQPLHRLPEEALIKGVAEHYEPIDPRVLADQETRAMVVKVMRADLQMYETYRPTPGPPLDMPIWVFAARGDRGAAPPDMQGWTKFSTGETNLREFDGTHFFIRDNEAFWPTLLNALATA